MTRSKIIYSPPRPQQRLPRWRVIVGMRLAIFHREGTLVRDSKGVIWRSWRDHEFDTWPAWEECLPHHEPVDSGTAPNGG